MEFLNKLYPLERLLLYKVDWVWSKDSIENLSEAFIEQSSGFSSQICSRMWDLEQ